MNENEVQGIRKKLIQLSHRCYQRGWSLATSSNYSVLLDSNEILITVSGKDKDELSEADTVLLNTTGEPVDPGTPAVPSSETLLHICLYRWNPSIRAVLHTHSVYATLLSSVVQHQIILQGYEMLKALSGVSTHEHREVIPIFSNTQALQELSNAIENYLSRHLNTHAFLVAAHGLYTWGNELEEANRHLEALEFLLECEYRKLQFR
jgi:methylthioribulose-1-phosphate dehydratase